MSTKRKIPDRLTLAAASAARQEASRIREAFRRRAGKAVEQIAQAASPDALAQALEASTDVGAVVSALAGTAIPRAALELDPFADAIARGIDARERLATRAGGLLTAAEIGRALGISRQAVDKRRRGHRLLAVPVAGDWRYPAAQLSDNGEVPPLLATVLAEGARLGLTDWAMLDFLLAEDKALGGLTPLAALRGGESGAADLRRMLAAMKADAFG